MVADISLKIQAAVRLMRYQACIAKSLISNKNKSYFNNNNGGFSNNIEIAVLRATSHVNASNDNFDTENNYNLENEILFLVSDNPESVMFLAQRLTRRLSKSKDLRVTLKALLLIHRLLRGGSRGFEQHIRAAHISGNLQLNLNQNINCSKRLMRFLHNYASYLEERLDWFINQSGKLEPVEVMHHQKVHYFDGSSERRMESVVLRILKYLQFLDCVMNCSPFDVVFVDKNSKGLAIATLRSTLKESFQVYISLWDSVVTLLNMYFDLPKGARVVACDVLKRAAKQSQELCNFYKNCRDVIEEQKNKQFVLNYPYVHVITMDHLLAMEQLNSADDMFSRPPSSSSSLTSTSCDENSSMETSLFSCKLETKVSKVWVVFGD